MKRHSRFALVSMFATAGLVAGASALIAQPATDKPQEMQLPEGWSPEDMQACMLAGTPGEVHERLAADAGVWKGQCSMWMVPDSEPMQSEAVTTVTPILDGRFVRVEMKGEIPGMGPHNAEGIFGYDNVSGQLVSNWISNCSTGIMHGVGESSADGKTVTWTYTYNCPITEKPTTIREVETHTGPDTKTLTSYGINPKTGEEFKMFYIEMKRDSGAASGARRGG